MPETVDGSIEVAGMTGGFPAAPEYAPAVHEYALALFEIPELT